nr:hypothetical protein [uncultured bacterium]
MSGSLAALRGLYKFPVKPSSGRRLVSAVPRQIVRRNTGTGLYREKLATRKEQTQLRDQGLQIYLRYISLPLKFSSQRQV